MVARTLILFTITALILAGFVWLAPLDVVLKAHGYSPTQITAMKTAAEPQPGPPCPAVQTGDNAATGVDTKPSAGQTQSNANENAAPQAQSPQAPAKQSPQAEKAEQPAAPPRKFVSTDTINVRAGQGTDTDVVGQLKPKTVVTVVDDPPGKWMKVKTDTVTGWVYRPLFEPQGE